MFMPSICMVCEVDDGALADPVACNVMVYVPGAEKTCVGFVCVEILFTPDVGSPKFQLVSGQRSEVFIKLIVVLLVQE